MFSNGNCDDSQGAAVMHGAIPRLSAAIKAQIAAAVLFGDTRNQQDRERIPDFDTGKTLIICNTGDLVCSGTLILTLAHFTYGSRVDDAVEFAASRIN
jgi:cutinase